MPNWRPFELLPYLFLTRWMMRTSSLHLFTIVCCLCVCVCLASCAVWATIYAQAHSYIRSFSEVRRRNSCVPARTQHSHEQCDAVIYRIARCAEDFAGGTETLLLHRIVNSVPLETAIGTEKVASRYICYDRFFVCCVLRAFSFVFIQRPVWSVIDGRKIIKN